MPISVNYPDFALNGRFGPLDRNSTAADLTELVGPSDTETTHPGCYSYGNFAFEVVPDVIANPIFRMRICVCIPHPDHFSVPYESWKTDRERFWNSLEHDYPDSRFDCVMGDLVQGATIEDLRQRYLLDAIELEFMDESNSPRKRAFLMPSGVTMWFSNYQSAGAYALYSLDTMDRWGPDVRNNQSMHRSGEVRPI